MPQRNVVLLFAARLVGDLAFVLRNQRAPRFALRTLEPARGGNRMCPIAALLIDDADLVERFAAIATPGCQLLESRLGVIHDTGAQVIIGPLDPPPRPIKTRVGHESVGTVR